MKENWAAKNAKLEIWPSPLRQNCQRVFKDGEMRALKLHAGPQKVDKWVFLLDLMWLKTTLVFCLLEKMLPFQDRAKLTNFFLIFSKLFGVEQRTEPAKTRNVSKKASNSFNLLIYEATWNSFESEQLQLTRLTRHLLDGTAKLVHFRNKRLNFFDSKRATLLDCYGRVERAACARRCWWSQITLSFFFFFN